MRTAIITTVILTSLGFTTGSLRAQTSFEEVSEEVNYKLVKLYGSGGFRGIAAYGTGIVISEDGYILTGATTMLNTSELRVHMADGRKHVAKVVVVEPALDLALLKIKNEEGFDLSLDYFDVLEAAKRPTAKTGSWVLAFSNQFEIATRDEPMSVQRGVIAAYMQLTGRRGIFAAPYTGNVYVIDAITNNPGAAGGAITTREGELIGVVGKELRNSLTDTWINYAIPINAEVEVEVEGKKVQVSLPDFVDRGMKGTYKATKYEREKPTGPGGYHGIVFVPNVVERTPPYIERVEDVSPAATSGLKPDDLVVFIDGEPVYSIKAFHEMMQRTREGMTVQLEVRRGDRLETISIKLDKQPKNR